MYVCLFLYVCMYLHIHIHICMYMCVLIHIYIYTYIHLLCQGAGSNLTHRSESAGERSAPWQRDVRVQGSGVWAMSFQGFGFFGGLKN